MERPLTIFVALVSTLGGILPARSVCAQTIRNIWLPEQRTVRVRDPAEFPRARIPADVVPPPTVSDLDEPRPSTPIELDFIIGQALSNAQVVRVLSGTGAASTGQTIFDPSIANTRIDQQQATFDPTVTVRQDFLRNETPFAIPDPLQPGRALIIGNRLDRNPTNVEVGQRLGAGGTASLQVGTDRLRRLPSTSVLQPESPSSVTLGLTQPLLQGAGVAVNRVPIVLARLDAEASYFRLKDGVQETVRGVIQAYWDLVAARTNVWAVERQVEQSRQFVEYESARLRFELGDEAQLAQANLALANFRANLIDAQARLLNAEAALRGILGLPPNAPDQLNPMTPPVTEELEFDWEALLSLAEERRPDIIELKIILEADYQTLLQSRNAALPQLDAVALYRWNGLEGEMPIGASIDSRDGAFTDWQMGVNFSVPVGLRRGRAALREQELILARDRANLEQALLEMVHDLASALRQLRQLYASYLAFRDTRLAASRNLEVQFTSVRAGTVAFINVQQAIVDWGNAVSAEARALSSYNAQLATLERLTGTILESHGVRFYEERYASLGPLGLLGRDRCYSRGLHPTQNEPRYPQSEGSVDELFQRGAPSLKRRRDDAKPSPSPPPDPRAEEELPPQ